MSLLDQVCRHRLRPRPERLAQQDVALPDAETAFPVMPVPRVANQYTSRLSAWLVDFPQGRFEELGKSSLPMRQGAARQKFMSPGVEN